MSTIVAPPLTGASLQQLEEAFALSSATSAIKTAFTEALQALAAGTSVRVEPIPDILTTSQAADLLGVSRPTMVKLLDSGVIPCEKPSVHRHVRLHDVLAYQRRQTVERQAALTDMRQQALDDGTYDISPDEYMPVADKVRHNHHS